MKSLKRTGERGAGTFQAISWDEAIGEVVKQLDALASAGNGQGLAIVTGGRRNQRQQVFEQFAAKFGAAAPITYELFSDDVLRHANAMSFGYAQLPTYDLANSAYVLGLGADFLGTWNSPVANAKAFGEMRGGRVGMRGAFVQVESRISPTGASADEWVAANPGTEGALALGLAHVILREKLRSADAGRAGALIDGWAAGLPDYTPEKVSTLTGVSAKRIERLAREFAERSPAVAIVGGTPLAHTNGLFTALAVNALNQLAGSVGQKGGLLFTPQLARPAAGERRTLAQLASGNAPRVLIVDDANPVFSAPKSWNLQQGFAKGPFIVSFAQFIDETSALADVILPDSTFLESWVDAAPESGSAAAVISVAAPAMKPLFQTRPTGDVVLEISRKLQKPLELPWQTYQDVLKATLAPAGEDAFTAAQKQSVDQLSAIAFKLSFEQGGKRTRIRDGNKYLRSALIQAAWASVKQADTFLAAFYRRLAARRGKKKAIVALAHKILVIIYTLLKTGQVYQERGAAALDEHQKERIVHRLERRIVQLGYTVHLEPVTTAAS